MLKKCARIAVFLGSLMLLSGCGSSNSNAPAGLSTTQGESILFATDGTMGYLSGYDSTEGTVVTVPCFNKVTNIAKDTSANPFANGYSYEMQMIESKTQLYDFLHASYQTDVGLLVAKNSIAVDMSNQFKHESSSIYVLVKSTWDGPAFIVNNPVFPEANKAEFLNKYHTYANFTAACGDTFVYGIQTGMHFYAMFKFNFSSTSEKNSVHAKLQNKTLTVKTKKELDNEMGFDTSSSNVTVVAKILGGSTDALDISKVRTVNDFFTFVDTYSASEKKAIQDGKADGLNNPDPGLAYGYAINAIVVPYKSFIRSQFGMDDAYFTAQLGSDWDNLKPIAEQFAEHKDAYNQLDFVVGNPNLFVSAVDPNSFLTAPEIATLTGYRDKFQASYEGLQELMQLCIEPDDYHTIKPNAAYATNVAGNFNGTSREYCKSLYSCATNTMAAECAQCDTALMCPLIYGKLGQLDEKSRVPFFTDSDIATSGVPTMGEVPRDCRSLNTAFPTLVNDGTYTVYYNGDADKPFTVDCEGMSTSAPTTYLKLNAGYVSADAQSATYNYSMYGTLIGGTTGTYGYEKRAWTKYQLQTGTTGVAINTGNILYSSHYDPYGLNYLNEAFRARSGFNKPASINMDLTGTGLAISADNKMEVWGYGFYIGRPYVTFDYYLDNADTGTYLEGMTAVISKGDPTHIFAANTDAPELIWLDYVPRGYNVLDNPADRRHSGNKTLGLSKFQSTTWCNGMSICGGPYLQSIQNIFDLTN